MTATTPVGCTTEVRLSDRWFVLTRDQIAATLAEDRGPEASEPALALALRVLGVVKRFDFDFLGAFAAPYLPDSGPSDDALEPRLLQVSLLVRSVRAEAMTAGYEEALGSAQVLLEDQAGAEELGVSFTDVVWSEDRIFAAIVTMSSPNTELEEQLHAAFLGVLGSTSVRPGP